MCVCVCLFVCLIELVTLCWICLWVVLILWTMCLILVVSGVLVHERVDDAGNCYKRGS